MHEQPTHKQNKIKRKFTYVHDATCQECTYATDIERSSAKLLRACIIILPGCQTHNALVVVTRILCTICRVDVQDRSVNDAFFFMKTSLFRADWPGISFTLAPRRSKVEKRFCVYDTCPHHGLSCKQKSQLGTLSSSASSKATQTVSLSKHNKANTTEWPWLISVQILKTQALFLKYAGFWIWGGE